MWYLLVSFVIYFGVGAMADSMAIPDHQEDLLLMLDVLVDH